MEQAEKVKEENDAMLMLYLSDGTDKQSRDAFAELYFRHGGFLHKSILNWCNKSGYDDSVADDLLNDLFLHIKIKAGTYKLDDSGNDDVERRKLRAWMYKVFNRLVISSVRDGRTPFHPVSAKFSPEIDVDELLRNEDSENKVVSAQMKELREAMELLSEKEQDVLRLVFMEKDPENLGARLKNGVTENIAELLNTSQVNVRQILKRALDKLKKHLNTDI